MGEPSPQRTHAIAWIVAAILLLVSIAGTFWVPIYARSAPKLGSFPFFYWYQLIWVPVVAILSWLSYLLIRPGRRGRHVAAPGTGDTGTGPADGGSGRAR